MSRLQLIRKPSLAAQTAELLREQIRRGDWAESLPGERKLCEQIGISRPILRAALAQLQREGLVKCGHGFRRQLVGSNSRISRPGGSKTVLLVTPLPLHLIRPQDLFWMDTLREQLGKAGYDLEIHRDRRCYLARPERALAELAGQFQPACWVLYASTAVMQRWFSEQRLPCVLSGSRHKNIVLPCVDRDYRAVCRHAAGLFLSKGHRRLALLIPDGDLAGERESEDGFREATRQCVEQGGEALVVRHDCTREGICNRLDGLLRRTRPPTAFMVSRTPQVLAAVGHLHQRGLRLPQDVSLISRDEDFFLDHVVPTVARYGLDPMGLARAIARAVLKQLRGDGGVTCHRFIPQFVPGETFGRCNRPD
jgi:DNA-binding LacI/PurR family transcriptional regulator